MRLLILLGLVAASGTAPMEVAPLVGYHQRVGIPEAARIKALEEKILSGELNSKIVGGGAAPVNAHPYLAGLIITFVNIAGESACGSSLVSANRLVTAAHCWFDGTYQARQFTVVLGTQFLFTGGTRIPTTQVVPHPQWSPSTLVNDIGIIYLPSNVVFSNKLAPSYVSSVHELSITYKLTMPENSLSAPFSVEEVKIVLHGLTDSSPGIDGIPYSFLVNASGTIQPIALPNSLDIGESFAGEWSVASGYGMTSDQATGVAANAFISEVSLQVITVAQCQANFGYWATSSNICTSGAGGVGICGGDSGGPLVVARNGQRVLVGVSSFVDWAGCQGGNPSAFARVTSFYSFIMQHLV